MIDMVVGLLINMLAIVAFLNINKFTAQKAKLTLVSLISTIIVAVVPGIGYRFDKSLGYYSFGFPADVLVYHGEMLYSVISFGLLANFFFFYWMFKLIVKLGVLISASKEGNSGEI